MKAARIINTGNWMEDQLVNCLRKMSLERINVL